MLERGEVLSEDIRQALLFFRDLVMAWPFFTAVAYIIPWHHGLSTVTAVLMSVAFGGWVAGCLGTMTYNLGWR